MKKEILRKQLELALNSEIETDWRGKEYIPVSGHYQAMLDRIVDSLILDNPKLKKIREGKYECKKCKRWVDEITKKEHKCKKL